MGIGDQLMAAGRAKLLHQKTGKLIAIGRPPSILIPCDLYNYNPYILRSGTVYSEKDVQWVFDYSGNRPYIDYKATAAHPDNRGMKRPYRWIWNMEHKPEPAEIFFSPEEKWQIETQLERREYVLVDPNIKRRAPLIKRWPFAYYQDVVYEIARYVEVIQPLHIQRDDRLLDGVQGWNANLRELAVLMSCAKCFLGNEGLPHHLAAAVNIPAVVVAGAFIPKSVTGYPSQTWFEVKDKRVLGVREHIQAGFDAMAQIEPQQVITAVKRILREGK